MKATKRKVTKKTKKRKVTHTGGMKKPVWWKVTTTSAKTFRSTTRKVKKTYDDMTRLLDKARHRSTVSDITAQEMDARGKEILESGRVLSVVSIEQERMLMEPIESEPDISAVYELEDSRW